MDGNIVNNTEVNGSDNLYAELISSNEPPLFMVIVFVIEAFLIFVLNLLIVCSGKFEPKLTPNAFVNRSLILAYAYTAFILGLTSILKYKLDISICVFNVFELLKIIGMWIESMHFASLAFCQHLVVRRMIQYPIIKSRMRAMLMILPLWTVPSAAIILYYLGNFEFETKKCSNGMVDDFSYTFSVTTTFCSIILFFLMLHIHMMVLLRRRTRIATEDSRSEPLKYPPSVVTTLLMLTVHIIGCMPTILIGVITCKSCAVPYWKLRVPTMVIWRIFATLMLFAKCLIVPLIFTMREIKIDTVMSTMFSTFISSIQGTWFGRQLESFLGTIFSTRLPTHDRSTFDSVATELERF